MANTVYDNSLVPDGYSNWNAYLNSFPKIERGAIKCDEIAEPERKKTGTNSYRINNNYVGTVSPVISRPWSASLVLNINFISEETDDTLTTEDDNPFIMENN